eukprot:COSAG04_NODE_3278_length_2981_cov_1.788688_4_plen_61_part_00
MAWERRTSQLLVSKRPRRRWERVEAIVKAREKRRERRDGEQLYAGDATARFLGLTETIDR